MGKGWDFGGGYPEISMILPSSKLRYGNGTSPFLNRRCIFEWLFSIVMLVFGGHTSHYTDLVGVFLPMSKSNWIISSSFGVKDKHLQQNSFFSSKRHSLKRTKNQKTIEKMTGNSGLSTLSHLWDANTFFFRTLWDVGFRPGTFH